jgi:hypothetical protein
MKIGVFENLRFVLTQFNCAYSPDVRKTFSFGAAHKLVTGHDRARTPRIATSTAVLT